MAINKFSLSLSQKFYSFLFCIAVGAHSGLYPSLDEYMGLNLSSAEVQSQLAVIPAQAQTVAIPTPSQVPGKVFLNSGLFQTENWLYSQLRFINLAELSRETIVHFMVIRKDRQCGKNIVLNCSCGTLQ